MDISEKLSLLGESAKYDVCASSAAPAKNFGAASIGRTLPSGVCHSFTPDGRCISLFKVLLTNQCERDCFYCPNRAARDIPRARFSPDELSGLFLEFYRRNYVEGLFLSSGIHHSSTRTMQELIETAEILRYKYKFGGYIHLKILPGASEAEVERAVELSNRVSLNIEVPNAVHLSKLSRAKNFAGDIMSGIHRIHRHLQNQAGTTQTTQFIVGAAQENDQDILSSISRLYSGYSMKRAYFSAFQPIEGTPLDHISGTPLIRENRLYQADFLFRNYGFLLKDLTFDSSGNLPVEVDPKWAFALSHPELYPLDVNLATMKDLLKIPGIGPRSAKRIVALRREHPFRSPDELSRVGIVMKRALPFILIHGRRFSTLKPVQLTEQRQIYSQPALWSDLA